MEATYIEGVKIFEQVISEGSIRKGKITILVGGLNQENPKEFMDEVVR